MLMVDVQVTSRHSFPNPTVNYFQSLIANTSIPSCNAPSFLPHHCPHAYNPGTAVCWCHYTSHLDIQTLKGERCKSCKQSYECCAPSAALAWEDSVIPKMPLPPFHVWNITTQSAPYSLFKAFQDSNVCKNHEGGLAMHHVT